MDNRLQRQDSTGQAEGVEESNANELDQADGRKEAVATSYVRGRSEATAAIRGLCVG